MSEENTDVTEIAPEVIERATLQGWAPKDQFRGDDSNWIPADQYVERADKIMPILKSTNKRLEGKVSSLEKTVSENNETMKRMAKIQTKFSEDSYAGRLSDIRAKKRVAMQDKNEAEYTRLEAEEDKLSKPEPIETTPQRDPDVKAWEERNADWYNIDQELTEYSDFCAEKLSKDGKQYNATEFCNIVEKKVKSMFPGKFENTNKKNPPMVDEPNGRGSDTNVPTGKKTWANVPEEARVQYADLASAKNGYTKEQFTADYFEGE